MSNNNTSLTVTKLNPSTTNSRKIPISNNSTVSVGSGLKKEDENQSHQKLSSHASGSSEKNLHTKITASQIQQIPSYKGKSNSDSKHITTVIATPGCDTNKPVKVQYCNQRVVGNGSFGVVYKAELCGTSLEYLKTQIGTNKTEDGDSDKKKRYLVAIKKVLQDRRFKNRELSIMRNLKHINIVQLKFYFYSMGEKKDEVYLNLILEFIPETVYRVSRHYSKQKSHIPMIFVQLYMYQLLRALAHIHSNNVCHRDIKPQNLLVDPASAVLKLCDFGSAKQLISGEPNVSYICSRYYRAPELIFGATDYTCSIDVWSCGCVLAELMLGQPIFPGESGVDQLVEIIKLLGTPTKESIKEMNPNYTEFKFPTIKAHPWAKVFKKNTPPSAVDMCSSLLEYSPKRRFTAFGSLTHTFFDDLRVPGLRLPNNRPLPPLFNFTEKELQIDPTKNRLLLPGQENSNCTSKSSESSKKN